MTEITKEQQAEVRNAMYAIEHSRKDKNGILRFEDGREVTKTLPSKTSDWFHECWETFNKEGG